MTSIYSDLYGSELGGRQGRKDHYRFSLLSLLKMSQADFICYTSDRELDDLKDFFYKNHNISEDRLKFVLFDLTQNEYTELINSVKNFDTIKTSDRCYDIQYSKFSWFKNEDKSYDYYFWFDAGLSHTGLIPDKYLSAPGYRGYYESTLFNDKFLTNLINYAGDEFVMVAKENSRNYLLANAKVADEIEKKIKSKLGIGVPRAVADLPIEDEVILDEVTEVVAPKAANA